MSMTVVMLFLIEATAACGPVAPARLGGGAEVVRAVLDFEEDAPETSVVTPAGLSRSSDAAPGDAQPATNAPDADPAPARCKPAPMPIA
jgi:hypothetical protein